MPSFPLLLGDNGWLNVGGVDVFIVRTLRDKMELVKNAFKRKRPGKLRGRAHQEFEMAGFGRDGKPIRDKKGKKKK